MSPPFLCSLDSSVGGEAHSACTFPVWPKFVSFPGLALHQVTRTEGMDGEFKSRELNEESFEAEERQWRLQPVYSS